MRLLDTSTRRFEEFFYKEKPLYAILSHTWGAEEVTYRDARDDNALNNSNKNGSQKIRAFCDEARRHGFGWAWVDTCCIDKTSSAELSEAINSMYAWYQQAAVCFVYLADVDGGADSGHTVSSSIYRSRWFTRSWTLQELLAPANVVFYDQYWTDVGTKRTLASVIAKITGIDGRLLSGEVGLSEYGVAQKMNWMSARQCTRLEDIAYSMLGLFQINMPLLYGEGNNAFRRLQEEIIKTYPRDHSIFAWKGETWRHGLKNDGLLASSPVEFFDSSAIVPVKADGQRDCALTSQGLKIDLPVHHIAGHFLAELDCRSLVNPDKRIAVVLEAPTSATSSYVDFTAVTLNEANLRSIRWPMRLVSRRINREGLQLIDPFPGIEATPLFIDSIWTDPSVGNYRSSAVDISIKHHFSDPSFSMRKSSFVAAQDRSRNLMSYTYGNDKEKLFCVKIQWDETIHGYPCAEIAVGNEQFLDEWAVVYVKETLDEAWMVIDEGSRQTARAWIRYGAKQSSSRGEILSLTLNVSIDSLVNSDT